MPADPPGPPALRASDADRDRVIEVLRHSRLAISRNGGDDAPETLSVHLVGRMKHGRIDTRWVAPRR